MSNSRPTVHRTTATRSNDDSKNKTRVSNSRRETSKERNEKKSSVQSKSGKSSLASYYSPQKESKAVLLSSTVGKPQIKSVLDAEINKSKHDRNKGTTKTSTRPSKPVDGIYSLQKAGKPPSKSKSSQQSSESAVKKLPVPRKSNAGTSESISRHSDSQQKSKPQSNPEVNIDAPAKRKPLMKQNTITLDSNDKTTAGSEEENDSYEDDFEDYESDFEVSTNSDEDESSVGSEKNEEDEQIKKRTAEMTQNLTDEPTKQPSVAPLTTDFSETVDVGTELILSTTSNTTNDSSVQERSQKVNSPTLLDESVPSSESISKKSHSHINFVNSKKSLSAQKAIMKAKKRGNQLLELITLDSVYFNLFSKSPAEYSEFMETFGNVNARQARVQTGEDSSHEEAQTDVIEMLDLWTQFPPHTCGAIGGQYVSQTEKGIENHGVKDWKRLNNFVKESGRVMCTLLEEEKSITDADRIASGSKEKLKFSDRVVILQKPQIANDNRAVSFVCYNKCQSNLLLAIYETPKTIQESLTSIHNKGIICVWNIFQPTRPQEVLVCSSKSICCCFGGNSKFVFAGMEDGSVATWDLRESCCIHQSVAIDNIDWVLRSPTYSTAEVLGDVGHQSPIVSILCNQSDNKKSDEIDDWGITQVATLEEQACIHIWIVTYITRTELGDTSNTTDLGLRPDGRIKLVKSATIDLKMITSLQPFMENNGRVLDFVCSPTDQNTFYVTTDTSIVVRCTVNNSKPKVYFETQETLLEVVSINFNPFEEFNLFLTGNNEGNVKLFSTSKENPIMTWTSNSSTPICKALWSNSTPNIFYSLDVSGQISLWDLSDDDRKPVISTNFKSQRVLCFDLSKDERHTSKSTAKLQPNLAIGYDNGKIEIHFLAEKYSRNSSEDRIMFKKYVEMF